MQSKFHSCLQSALILSAGLSLGLFTLISVAEARIISNGTFPNGTVFNGTFPNGTFPNGTVFNDVNLKFDTASTSQLQLEGSQLVLHLNR